MSAPKKRRGKHTLEHNAEARVKTGNATIRAAPAGRSAVLLVPPADCPELPELRASVPTPHGRIEVEIARETQGRAVYRYVLPAACRGFLRLASGLTPITATPGAITL